MEQVEDFEYTEDYDDMSYDALNQIWGNHLTQIKENYPIGEIPVIDEYISPLSRDFYNEIYRKINIRPTAEQKVIIEYNPYCDISVSAAPGSAKTTTILLRILYLITNYNINPGEICLLTYNRSLSKDMKSKMGKLCGSINLGFCGTIHSYCYRITQSVDNLNLWIDKFKNCSNVDPMLKYIFFDEYQDAYKDISEVVEILARKKYLTILGDERQQIYEFMGSDANYLLNLRDYVKLTLTESFRCNKHLCKLLANLYPSYPIISSSKNGQRPFLYRSFHERMCDQKVIDKICDLVSKHKNGSIAILSPCSGSGASHKFLGEIICTIFQRYGVFFSLSENDKEMRSEYHCGTIHSSKGREYDTVILVNVLFTEYTFNYPSPDSLSRLFVGLSRARENLYVFENLFYKAKTLPWIYNNEDLFEHEDGWIRPPILDYPENISNMTTKNVSDFMRFLPDERKNILSSYYSNEELVSNEEGLLRHFGTPRFSGMLIEKLMAIKLLNEVPTLRYPIYIITDQWKKIAKLKSTECIKEKIEMLYPNYTEQILQSEKSIKFKITSDDQSYILSVKNIVSKEIYDFYYSMLSYILIEQKRITTNLDESNIRRIFDLLKFEFFMNFDLIGITETSLSSGEISEIIKYIDGSHILFDLDIKKYHRNVANYFRILPNDKITMVTGEQDFITDDALIEFKCYSDDISLNDAWIQTIIYNMISKEERNHHYETLYVYNAITGNLYRRKLLNPELPFIYYRILKNILRNEKYGEFGFCRSCKTTGYIWIKSRICAECTDVSYREIEMKRLIPD